MMSSGTKCPPVLTSNTAVVVTFWRYQCGNQKL